MIIGEKVKDAREFFNIKKYPGNFFDYLIKDNDYINKYGILLFKQDLGDSISGFIGYVDETPVICINNDRTIGHQNFTLAHEIGHYFLHRGESVDDTQRDIDSHSGDEKEKDAHAFASELIYPVEFLKKDFEHALNNNLFNSKKRIELADFVNELCHKYCTSFSFTIHKLLYSIGHPKSNKIIDSVMAEVGGLNNRYNSALYNKHANDINYKTFSPIKLMEDYIMKLSDSKKISYDTGQVILKNNLDLGV
ncbi:MAG: ImmA/IrrE family metallo-endopeptidase [Firmicutes bacterium]|nr:ImmA/IrrE family metallo-endopeptidase [Bacillota bacterium]